MTLTFGSLFAGIGGFDLGFERAGMECRWQVEIDPFCQKVLAKHWPDVARYADVRDCGEHNLEPVDLICGGFPCQPHSVAGKRRGAEDDRDLWPEYRRIVKELQPEWVVGENVPGIITTILDDVLSDLADLAYTYVPLDIPACAFGAQHVRERIFVVAHLEGKGLAKRQRQQGCDRPLYETASIGGLPGLAGNNSTGYNWGRNWPTESRLLRRLHGLPNRVDRLRALGNAIVPQVAEWLGRCIMEVEAQL